MFDRLQQRTFLWLCLSLLSQGVKADLDTSARLKVVASNYPLAYFAERIAGTRASVSMPVPEGEDPAFWKPSQADIGAMQRADLILLNGADFEKWLTRVSLPRLKLADTSASFNKDYIVIENAVTHSHGPGGQHSHSGTAFTTWLDFHQAAIQSEAVAAALARKRPELKSLFADNLNALRADLEGLDAEFKAITRAKPGTALLGSHPVYQYLARRYALNLQSVHWEPNEMPPSSEWQALETMNKARHAQWMLWEAEPKEDIVTRLKQAGVQSAVFDPCSNRPARGDFLSVMRQNQVNLKQALGLR